MKVASLKLTSRPAETESRFKKRVADLLRTKKEAASDKFTEQYAKKQRRLATRLDKAYARVDKEKGDVKRAEDDVRLIQEDIDALALALELQEKLAVLSDTFDPERYTVETFNITPRHQDIYNLQVRLLWEPVLDLTGVYSDRAIPG